MKEQIELFDEPVSLTSQRFINRLASVVRARGGATYTEAYEMAHKSIDGTLCACCGARLQVYRRAINRGQVETLRDLCARFDVGQRFESKDIRARGGDYAKLVAFGLLYQFDDGGWCLTSHGVEFAKGERPASRYAFFYLGELVGLSVSAARVIDQVVGFTLDTIKPFGVEMVFIK